MWLRALFKFFALDSIARQKQVLRREASARRDALSPEYRAKASLEIAERAMTVPQLASARIVAGYWPIRSEVDPRPLMEMLHARGQKLALPRVEGSALVFKSWAPGQALCNGAFGVQEPFIEAPAVIPDAILVPLLAFDDRGGRLGYGKGFYDRVLICFSNATGIGLAFADQKFEIIPYEAFDIDLKWIVTNI